MIGGIALIAAALFPVFRTRRHRERASRAAAAAAAGLSKEGKEGTGSAVDEDDDEDEDEDDDSSNGGPHSRKPEMDAGQTRYEMPGDGGGDSSERQGLRGKDEARTAEGVTRNGVGGSAWRAELDAGEVSHELPR